ncbi:HAD family hydrolase [Halalkalibacter alkalisediminis]|uniref:HAD family hydrolase n=1 Tax=Halalkalibacter alkalisediminis TaxID=935616 RepID=A0ABV6NL80_9BACI|nr:HAD family hydrolase [Halalkalibacter alkalisediminis]
MLENIELILFDLDNTLYDFNDKWNVGTFNTFNNSKLTKGLSFEEFIIQYKKNDNRYWDLHHKGEVELDDVRRLRLIDTLKFFKRNVTSEEADLYFQEFISEVFDLIEPDEKINQFLREIKDSYKVGIITNGKIHEQQVKIRNLGLDRLIPNEHIFISDDIGYSKPHSKAFLTALDYFKIKPVNTVYIGDSWDNDILGSKDVGINPIWINLYSKERKDNEPVLTYKNIYNLIDDWQSKVVIN